MDTHLAAPQVAVCPVHAGMRHSWTTIVEGEVIMAQQQQLHRETVTASVQTMASVLQDVLSRRITAFTVGVKHTKTVSRWASGEVTEIRDPDVEQRLRVAYLVVQMLLGFDSPRTVRAWFIGMNPELDDQSPAEVIREGSGSEVVGAARVFITNG